MLKHRLITAFFMIFIVITVLFLLPFIVFAVITITICIASAWEWGKIAGFSSQIQRIWLGIICGLLLALITFTVPDSKPLVTVWKTKYVFFIALVWWLKALLLVLYYPRSAMIWRKSRFIRLAFGIFTIFPFFFGIIMLRQYNYDSNQFTGAWLILYIMILVWSADSGAYIFGRIIGTHKLAPRVSPSKTWEGLIGGLITSAFTAWILIKYSPLEFTPIALFICSIVAVLASVLGDLTESMFKRESNIKDSSNLIPGHGGILDRIDSLTAAVPVFTFLMLVVFKAI